MAGGNWGHPKGTLCHEEAAGHRAIGSSSAPLTAWVIGFPPSKHFFHLPLCPQDPQPASYFSPALSQFHRCEKPDTCCKDRGAVSANGSGIMACISSPVCSLFPTPSMWCCLGRHTDTPAAGAVVMMSRAPCSVAVLV